MTSSRRAYLDWPAPIPFAHRGGAGDQPENTMAAFAAAVELGYTYVETDVHASRDGVLMAFHDDALDRLTDMSGRIADRTSDDIAHADAGHWFTTDGGRTYPCRAAGHRIPRLADILEQWPDVRVNIDPKADSAIEPLAALIRRMNVYDRVCVGSFSDLRLGRFRRLVDDRVCTSMGPRSFAVVRLAAWGARRVPRLGADCMQIPVRQGRIPLLDRSLVSAAHRAGLAVHIWTIDDEREMNRLLDLDVDGIMSDRPRVLRAVLEGRGLWHGPAATPPAQASTVSDRPDPR